MTLCTNVYIEKSSLTHDNFFLPHLPGVEGVSGPGGPGKGGILPAGRCGTGAEPEGARGLEYPAGTTRGSLFL